MIFLGFPVFIVFLSAIPLYGAVCLKYRPERLFAAGLLLNALVFYFACAANVCTLGFHAIFFGNLALYVPALMKLRREKEAFRRFLTPGVQVLYLAIAIGFLLAQNEQLFLWDEYSHWGTTAKLLLKYGGLNCRFSGMLMHASYPPGLPVLDVLVHKCFFGLPFHPGLPRFAVRTALLCLLAFPFGDAPMRKPFLKCLEELLVFWCIACLFWPWGAIWSCEADFILGTVFATAVYVVMRHDRSWRDDLLLALLCAWLFLIKKAGMGFAVMVQLLYIVRRIADWRSGEKPKRPVWSAIVVLAAPFVMQASWSLLLKLHHTTIVFPVGKISARGIFRMIAYGEPEHCRTVVGRFGMKLVRHILPFAIAVGGLVWYRRAADDRPRRTTDLFWFLPFALAAFLVSLFLTYMFIFIPIQALRLDSFERYLNSFMLMPLAVLLMLAFTSRCRKSRKTPPASYALLPVAFILLYNNYRGTTEAAGWYVKDLKKDCASLERRHGDIMRDPGTRFVVISGFGCGLYRHLLVYAYEDKVVDEIVADEPEKWPPEELLKYCRRAPYVLIVSPIDTLKKNYAGLFEEPPEFGERFTLFTVTPAGKLRAVPAR